jgi:hypothetical protein
MAGRVTASPGARPNEVACELGYGSENVKHQTTIRADRV